VCVCSTLEECVTGNCVSFSKSVLSLLVWLLHIIQRSIEHHVVSTAADKALGLPVPSIDGAFSYGSLIDRACDSIEKLTSSKTISALMCIAATDDSGFSGFFGFFIMMYWIMICSTGRLGISLYHNCDSTMIRLCHDAFDYDVSDRN